MILEVKNLDYDGFNKFNISFDANRTYSIIGNINCHSETLFRIISTSIMTKDTVIFNNITLNDKTRMKYLRRMGVIKEASNNSFLQEKVIDELSIPLRNLNYDETEIKKLIDFYLNYFNLRIKTKKINDLNIYEKQLLLVIMGLIHEPLVVIMEDIYSNLKLDDVIKVNKLLCCLVDNKKLTVIKFFNNFDFTNHSDYIYVMDDYEIIKEGIKDDVLVDDQFLNKHNLRVPFMYDLSIKLKMYKLIDKIYLNMEDMVNDIWK